MNPLRVVKNALVPSGSRPRTILAGPFRGIRMDLDLRTESQILVGLFERELHPWLTRLAKGIRSAVDIGAAHGEYTLYALRNTSAEQVVSFEPDPRLLKQFHRNLELNGLDRDPRLQLHTKFLSDKEGPDSMDASILAGTLLSPCLIKMDIDGGEAIVLRAASKRLLLAPGMRWIVETHSKELEAECIAIFQSLGYSTTIVPNARWRALIPEQRFREHNRWLIATR